MQSLFGLNLSPAMTYVLAFVIIFGLLALFAFVLRKLTGGKMRLSGTPPRARQPRLGIVDIYDLDRQRQLVLLRRDNVEHLLLIGGPNDVVVETNIMRAGARTAAAPAGESLERLAPAAPPVAMPELETAVAAAVAPTPAPYRAPEPEPMRAAEPALEERRDLRPPESRAPAFPPFPSRPRPERAAPPVHEDMPEALRPDQVSIDQRRQEPAFPEAPRPEIPRANLRPRPSEPPVVAAPEPAPEPAARKESIGRGFGSVLAGALSGGRKTGERKPAEPAPDPAAPAPFDPFPMRDTPEPAARGSTAREPNPREPAPFDFASLIQRPPSIEPVPPPAAAPEPIAEEVPETVPGAKAMPEHEAPPPPRPRPDFAIPDDIARKLEEALQKPYATVQPVRSDLAESRAIDVREPAAPAEPASAPAAPEPAESPFVVANELEASQALAEEPPAPPPASEPPRPAPAPAPAPASAAPAKAPDENPDPFSVEAIEAEFARLLGRANPPKG